MPDLDRPPKKYGSAPPQGVGFGTWRGLNRPHTESWRAPYYRNETDGLPGPSLELRHYGAFRLLWPVEPGSRTFTIWCRHSGHTPRPQVRLAADPSLGVPSDITAEAQDTSDWHQISLSVTTSARGVLEVYLEHRATESAAWSRWDQAEVS